jgi:hypothetical protein
MGRADRGGEIVIDRKWEERMSEHTKTSPAEWTLGSTACPVDLNSFGDLNEPNAMTFSGESCPIFSGKNETDPQQRTIDRYSELTAEYVAEFRGLRAEIDGLKAELEQYHTSIQNAAIREAEKDATLATLTRREAGLRKALAGLVDEARSADSLAAEICVKQADVQRAAFGAVLGLVASLVSKLFANKLDAILARDFTEDSE